MEHDVKLFFAILPVFLMIDYLWLGRIMQRFYLREMGDLARREGENMKPRLLAAAGVYLALPGGIVLFVLPRVDPAAPLVSALGWGFVYGVVVYSVYDLTNRATLEHWPVRLVLVDIGWGGFICAVVTAAGSLLSQVIH